MSRFYMYDSYSNSYAPVAEFAGAAMDNQTRAILDRNKSKTNNKNKGGGNKQGRKATVVPMQPLNNAPSYPSSKLTDKPQGAYTMLADRAKNPLIRTRASAKRAMSALTMPSGVGRTNAGLLREVGNRVRNVASSGRVGQAGLAGAGLLGAGALIGGGLAANKARKNRKAEAAKSPLRKRYESLRNRMGR